MIDPSTFTQSDIRMDRGLFLVSAAIFLALIFSGLAVRHLSPCPM